MPIQNKGELENRPLQTLKFRRMIVYFCYFLAPLPPCKRLQCKLNSVKRFSDSACGKGRAQVAFPARAARDTSFEPYSKSITTGNIHIIKLFIRKIKSPDSGHTPKLPLPTTNLYNHVLFDVKKKNSR